MVKLVSFDDAIAESAKFKKRHLLLGNGFSIACRPKIFTYGSLFEQADFSKLPEIPKLFEALKTTDFERVIKALEEASKTLPVYDPSQSSLAAKMGKDAESLKDLLISTVGNNHPGIPNEIDDSQFWACRRFLAHFLGPGNDSGKVYTLNYDLLLYWALMHDDNPFDTPLALESNDGFGRDEDTEPEYVNWLGESGADGQRVHYLHGALHLFDAGAELQKYTWVNTGVPLLKQARAAMSAGMFPLFVAEGKSQQKLAKIKHSAYLHHSYKSFARQMQQRNDAIFIYGHSLAENDEHILKKIGRGKIAKAYIGIYGDPNSDGNKQIVAAAEHMVAQRHQSASLSITYFDAASAKVWESK